MMKQQGIKEKEIMKNKFSSSQNYYQEDYEEISDDDNDNDDVNENNENNLNPNYVVY